MARCIAILTLALTAALSADQAFAQVDSSTDSITSLLAPDVDLFDGTIIDNTGRYYLRDGKDGSEWNGDGYQGDGDYNDAVIRADSVTYYPGKNLFGSVNLGGQEGSPVCDDAALGIIAAIAIPNLLEVVIDVVDTEGPEAAYQMLRDMGFSDREAYEIVLGYNNGHPTDPNFWN